MIPDKDVPKKNKIPNGSTPIKNDILIEIIAKGKLNLTEMRIVAYIIRYSWGFTNGDGRQNWTKPIKISEIAKDIGISRSLCSRIINKMIKENKLFIKDNCYQFNEHYDTWEEVLTKSNTQEVLTKSNAKCELKVTPLLTKSNASPQKNTIPISDSQIPKETLKKKKETSLLHNDNIQNIPFPKHKKEKEEIDNVYFNFVKKFAEIVNITLDRGFINKNIKHAKNLLKQYQEQEIIDIIHWRLSNDSDGYYQKHLTNLGFVYSHIAEWIKLKNIPKMTVEEFLKKNPNLDWREIDDKVIRYETFFKTFKIMKNNPNVLIDDEMWDKYKRMHRKYLDVLKGDE